jgi:hypothetical protein
MSIHDKTRFTPKQGTMTHAQLSLRDAFVACFARGTTGNQVLDPKGAILFVVAVLFLGQE